MPDPSSTEPGTHIEIERKFLLRSAPSSAQLAAHGARPRRIEQIYLVDPPSGRRIRCIEHDDGVVERVLTRKERLDSCTFSEQEQAIDAARYEALRREADPARRPIRKTRFVVPHGTQVLEIDVFEVPAGLVVLEVELRSKGEVVDLPDWVGEWREVTEDPRYLNANLARPDRPAPAW